MDKSIYHTGAWERLRLQVLNRDHWLCQFCLRNGRMAYAREVHHLVPVEDDPALALSPDNLVSLCRSCHEGTKRRGSGVPEPPAGVRVIRV